MEGREIREAKRPRTREKDIRGPDPEAVAGKRMKETFIRTKEAAREHQGEKPETASGSLKEGSPISQTGERVTNSVSSTGSASVESGRNAFRARQALKAQRKKLEKNALDAESPTRSQPVEGLDVVENLVSEPDPGHEDREAVPTEIEATSSENRTGSVVAEPLLTPPETAHHLIYSNPSVSSAGRPSPVRKPTAQERGRELFRQKTIREKKRASALRETATAEAAAEPLAAETLAADRSVAPEESSQLLHPREVPEQPAEGEAGESSGYQEKGRTRVKEDAKREQKRKKTTKKRKEQRGQEQQEQQEKQEKQESTDPAEEPLRASVEQSDIPEAFEAPEQKTREDWSSPQENNWPEEPENNWAVPDALDKPKSPEPEYLDAQWEPAESSTERGSAKIRGKPETHDRIRTWEEVNRPEVRTRGGADQTTRGPVFLKKTSVRTREAEAAASVPVSANLESPPGNEAAKHRFRLGKQIREMTRKMTGKTAEAAGTARRPAGNGFQKHRAGQNPLLLGICLGGLAVVYVIVLLCIIGMVAVSPEGVVFSGDPASGDMTMMTAVQAIDQEYQNRIQAIQDENPHDELEITGGPAEWADVLAVYTALLTADPDNPQDAATMNDMRQALLGQVFWTMNEVTYELIPDPTSGARILRIQVQAKTATETAQRLGFTQKQQDVVAELMSEENRDLWNALLHGSGTGNEEIVAVALSQVGNVNGQPYWSWYGFHSRVEWCACFVSWCANQSGLIDAGLVPKFASCRVGSNWYKERDLWQPRSYVPRPGDIIFFDWDKQGRGQDGSPDHVGIVERVENGRVHTVEGNSGNSCRKRSYAIGYYEIYGYGTPQYGESAA